MLCENKKIMNCFLSNETFKISNENEARIFHFMALLIYVLFIQAKEHFLSISKFLQTQDKKDWVIDGA